MRAKYSSLLSQISCVSLHRWEEVPTFGLQNGCRKVSCSPVSLYNTAWGENAAYTNGFGYDILAVNPTGLGMLKLQWPWDISGVFWK